MKKIMEILMLLTAGLLVIYGVTAKAVASEDESAAQASRDTIEIRSYNSNKTEDIGVGFKMGGLSGISAKYWVDEAQAWDAALGFDRDNTAVNIDYIWNYRNLIMTNFSNIEKPERFVPYLGVGLILGSGSRSQYFNSETTTFGLGARAPLGIEFLPVTARVGAFGEIALNVGMTPIAYTFFTAELGARYYF